MPSANRRDFLKTTAAVGAAVTLTAASYDRVYGANGRIGVGFVGVGGRCQAHLDVVNKLAKENKGAAPVAVCDVWDGLERQYESGGRKRTYLQGLYPSAKKVGLDPDDKKHVVKDYRRLLELPEVDVVCIATPDHWHAKISIDAAAAGKDVYCEKPMTKTIDEAHAVVDAMQKYNRVMTVGVQSMAEPRWREANALIKSGAVGHISQAQTSYYRNSTMGQWRYYRLWKEQNPKTIDWDMFLGHNFSINGGPPLGPSQQEMPFDRAVFAQWRCYWPFGGGMYTDLFVHQTTHMISAMGVKYPARVVGGGGLYLEYDGRDVPDVAAIVADYDEGCQLVIMATMINDYPIEEVIRGKLATIKFTTRDGKMGYEVLPQGASGGPGRPKVAGEEKGNLQAAMPNRDTTPELWENFLECVRSRQRATFSPPELGAAAFTTVSLGVKSYREGKALFWDKEQRKPTEADASWASRWEARSKKHGKPNQIAGWHGDEKGSTITPEDYQKLGGPWINGKDPAGSA
ncbi:MAG TPA: Gfo/Idh/MocA family oxidoreductase [Gemmataceae bacterium]|jgi:predicted dehydrogenase